MPETMSPREKVAELIYDRLGIGSDNESIEQVSGEILAALASSGDHAELARLADDLRKFEHHAVGSLKIDMAEVRRIIAACDTHAALLAKNAALRGANYIQSQDMITSDARATEAERKLAEAVGHGRKLLYLVDGGPSTGNIVHEWTEAARTFLSKEAERG